MTSYYYTHTYQTTSHLIAEVACCFIAEVLNYFFGAQQSGVLSAVGLLQGDGCGFGRHEHVATLAVFLNHAP